MLDVGCWMLKLGTVLRERLQRKSRSENGASEASVSFHEELQRKARYFLQGKSKGKIHAKKNCNFGLIFENFP